MAKASHLRHRFRNALAAAGGSGMLLTGQLLIAPGTAAAATPLTITADRAAAIPAGHNWSYNDFFPRTIAVAQGTTIRFDIQGFHTATLVPAGPGPGTIRATMGLVTADAEDTAANPNGTTHTSLNLASVSPIPGGCGSAASPCTFDGTSPVSSGAPLAGPVAPLNVKITAPLGFYRYVCLIHPKMQGWLAVVPQDLHQTTAAELSATVAAQITADKAKGYAAEDAASKAAVHHNADGTRTWTLTAGTGSPDGFVTVLEMLPLKVTIKKGDQVTWVDRSVNEPHTVTFPKDLLTDMIPMCENGGTDVPAVPTKIPPTGPQDFSCNGGPPDEVEFAPGNGVNNVTSPSTVADSGLLASSAELAGFSLPSTAANGQWTASFAGAAAGTYHYVCQIHQGMAGTIVVH